jgi:hypothetical protein
MRGVKWLRSLPSKHLSIVALRSNHVRKFFVYYLFTEFASHICLLIYMRGLECLRSLTSKQGPSSLWVRITSGALNLNVSSCGGTVCLRNVCGSTQVRVRTCNNARMGTRDFSLPLKLERCHMTFTVFIRRNTQPNKCMLLT